MAEKEMRARGTIWVKAPHESCAFGLDICKEIDQLLRDKGIEDVSVKVRHYG